LAGQHLPAGPQLRSRRFGVFVMLSDLMPAQGDPFKTLFVGRLSYDATEKKLQREFGEFGPIKSIRLVSNKDTGWAHALPNKAQVN